MKHFRTDITSFVSYWRSLLTVLFAVAVFCFWLFKLPFLMTAREQVQLFLWTTDYLQERLAVPGGLAQYLGEMVVQLFLNPVYGALWYAVLFSAVQWLVWRLVNNVQCTMHNAQLSISQSLNLSISQYLLSFVPSCILWCLACCPSIPMTPIIAILLTLTMMHLLPKRRRISAGCLMTVVGYWLLGPAVVIMAVYLLFCRRRDGSFVATRDGSFVATKEPSLLRPVPLILLALSIVGSSWIAPYPLKQIARGIDYYWEKTSMGTLDEMEYDMLMRRQRWDEMIELYNRKGSESLSVYNAVQVAMWQQNRISRQEMLGHINIDQRALSSIPSAFLMSEFSMLVGLTNMSQRAAFEAMEAIPNYNKSVRALQRLVETNVITGNHKVALKYISLLERTTFYRGYAHKMKALTTDPGRLKDYPGLYQLKEIYEREDDMLFY